MNKCAKVKIMILSAPDVETANEIIDINYCFISYREKIAFLKGMFDTEVIGKTNDESDETIYFTILNTILSTPILDNRAVKKTLTIPSWLNDLAIENNINFSQTLQEAIKEKLGLK